MIRSDHKALVILFPINLMEELNTTWSPHLLKVSSYPTHSTASVLISQYDQASKECWGWGADKQSVQPVLAWAHRHHGIPITLKQVLQYLVVPLVKFTIGRISSKETETFYSSLILARMYLCQTLRTGKPKQLQFHGPLLQRPLGESREGIWLHREQSLSCRPHGYQIYESPKTKGR